MAPMIDVLLVRLIIFMAIAPARSAGLEGTRTPDLLRVKKPCILLGFHCSLVFA